MMKLICFFYFFLVTCVVTQETKSAKCLSGFLNLKDGDSCYDDTCGESFCFTNESLTEHCGEVPKNACPAVIRSRASDNSYCGKCFEMKTTFPCDEEPCEPHEVVSYLKVVGKENSNLLNPEAIYIHSNNFDTNCQGCYIPQKGLLLPSYNYQCNNPQDNLSFLKCLRTEVQDPPIIPIPSEWPDILPTLDIPELPDLPIDLPSSIALPALPARDSCFPIFGGIILQAEYDFELTEVACDSGPDPTTSTSTSTRPPVDGGFYAQVGCGELPIDEACGPEHVCGCLTQEEIDAPCGDYPSNSCPILLNDVNEILDLEEECGKCYEMTIEFDCEDDNTSCKSQKSIFVKPRGSYNDRIGRADFKMAGDPFQTVCPAGCVRWNRKGGFGPLGVQFECMTSILDECLGLSSIPDPDDLPPLEDLEGLPIADVCSAGIYTQAINFVIRHFFPPGSGIEIPEVQNPYPWKSYSILKEVDCSISPPPTTQKPSTTKTVVTSAAPTTIVTVTGNNPGTNTSPGMEDDSKTSTTEIIPEVEDLDHAFALVFCSPILLLLQ